MPKEMAKTLQKMKDVQLVCKELKDVDVEEM